MPYELSPVQQKFAESQVANGSYTSTEKVVDAALMLLRTQQAEYERLTVAFQELQQGDHHPLDIDEIKQMGRELLEAKRSKSEC